MRIAIVGPTHPYKGGIAQHTTELAHRLAARGHQVAIESWSDQYPARLYPGVQRVGEPEMEPFATTRYPLSWRRPDGWVRLGRRLRRQVDAVILVVVTPIQAPAYLAILAALGAGGRRGPTVVALCHNVLPHERRAVDEPLVRAVLRRSSAVLVHTTAQAELASTLTSAPVRVARMAPHLWSSPTRRTRPTDPVPARSGQPTAADEVASDRQPDTQIVPEGRVVPDKQIVPDKQVVPEEQVVRAGRAVLEARAVPEAQAVPGEQVRRALLFFGLVRPYKGLDVLLRALARGPAEVRLTVAGEFWGGPATTARLIDELGLADRVDLRPGYVDAADVPGLFAEADALVLPYRAGTASQNVDLAHLHGVPVVATTVGTLADAVQDGVDGLLVPPDDAVALAAALRRLYEPGVLAGLRSKVAPPDPRGAWDRYLDTVQDLLGGPAPGPSGAG